MSQDTVFCFNEERTDTELSLLNIWSTTLKIQDDSSIRRALYGAPKAATPSVSHRL